MTERLSDERLRKVADEGFALNQDRVGEMARELLALRNFQEDVRALIEKLHKLWDDDMDSQVGKTLIACLDPKLRYSPLTSRISAALAKKHGPHMTDEQPVGFARGSIVREFGDGPNMLVVRSSADHTFVVVCEGDNDGTLRAREYPTGDLDQVLGDGAQQDREFDLRWKAQMRAIARWRDANPGNDLVMPDHADLVVWLLDQLAAGPVMPEMPTAEALNAAYQAGHMDLDHSHRTYDAIRAALMK